MSGDHLNEGNSWRQVQKGREAAYCSSLGAVNIAVGDDLGKRDNPVVYLVSSPPFN